MYCMSAQCPLLPLTSAGLPLYQSELASMADKALIVTMTQVNNLYAGLRLYRVTHGSILMSLLFHVVPLGLNTYDLMMNFGIKESDCLKSSGEDPQRCSFRGLLCELTQVVSLNCGQDSSSSESSSEEGREGCPIDEENRRVKRQQLNVQPFGNRGNPALSAPGISEAPLFPSHYFSRQEVEPQLIPGGDSIGNHLE
uniref:Secreted phosphoprotein 24 n=1 Tax=Hucho hucho TaxID=62062 RepID=A0A4W5MRP6_9TELE